MLGPFIGWVRLPQPRRGVHYRPYSSWRRHHEHGGVCGYPAGESSHFSWRPRGVRSRKVHTGAERLDAAAVGEVGAIGLPAVTKEHAQAERLAVLVLARLRTLVPTLKVWRGRSTTPSWPARGDDFDDIFGRIRDRGLAHWADPGRTRPGDDR
jgi:hypothetical protein